MSCDGTVSLLGLRRLHVCCYSIPLNIIQMLLDPSFFTQTLILHIMGSNGFPIWRCVARFKHFNYMFKARVLTVLNGITSFAMKQHIVSVSIFHLGLCLLIGFCASNIAGSCCCTPPVFIGMVHCDSPRIYWHRLSFLTNSHFLPFPSQQAQQNVHCLSEGVYQKCYHNT